MSALHRKALLVALLLPMAGQASAATHDALAAQVNARIVQRQVNQNVAMMADGAGAGFLPQALPEACAPAMRTAVAGMSSELVRFMQETFNDPVYQRAFEQQLREAYPAAQLQAFLDRSDSEALGLLGGEVMAAPGLQAAQDAHMAKLTETADQAMDADPRLQQALAAVRSANEGCDAVRMQAEAQS